MINPSRAKTPAPLCPILIPKILLVLVLVIEQCAKLPHDPLISKVVFLFISE
jgi:hypothetical protein